MVPQRVDPGRDATSPASPGLGGGKKAASLYEADGGADFVKTVASQPEDVRAFLTPIIEWAQALERDGLARRYSFHTSANSSLPPTPPGQDVGPFTVWGAGRMTAFKTVLRDNAPSTLEKLDARLGKPVGQGSLVSPLDEEMLTLMRAAFEEAASSE